MPILPHGLFRRLPITLLLLSVAPAALAQVPSGTIVQPLSQSSDPAELLAQALRMLATEPANLPALTAAGHNALILGDPNAAVGFFGRAQEIAPTNGAVKAGLGSALVQLEKPQDALRLFAEASRLGVPDADMAEDRGLAYDLTGQQSLAQRDYQTVLAGHPDDDTARRRLALSQGISGNKAGAIATLDPLIRKRDIAGWRAQTFVLAMDGDAKGANDITRIMLPQQSAMLQPFLVRLATLSPADKARAVHFGEMPSNGTPYTPTQMASIDTPPTYASAPAPTPRSDLAVAKPAASVPAAKPAPTTVVQPAPKQAAPAQLASAAPPRRPTQHPPGVTMNDRDAIFAFGQPYYKSAPLAGIALTPAKPASSAPSTATPASPVPSSPPPTPTVVAQTPAPSAPLPVQVAQASPMPDGSAVPPTSALQLPTPAAQGHYDLPHDAVVKGAARPSRSTPNPVPMKTVGTPVVHGKTAAPATADDISADSIKKATKAKVASADDADAIPSKSHKPVIDDCLPAPKSKSKTKGRAAKASARCTDLASADADDSVATRGKKTTATSNDCAPAPKSRSKAKGKVAKPSVSCKRVTSNDDDDSAVTTTRKAVAADDCPPASKSRSKTKGKASKLSTRCTKLASTDDDDDTPVKATKGKKPSADDADTKSTKSSKSAKSADKPAAERVYVQVAGGANKDDMDKAWAGVKKKAPELMKGHSPLTTPLRATNRLLVGPFKDEDEAQAFVNKMAAKGVSGFTFKSSKGQKVEKIDSGG